MNIVTPYATFWRFAEQDKKFKQAWHSADIAFPDGISLFWAKSMYEKDLNRNTLIRFMQVLFYGGLNYVKILLGKLEVPGELERISGADFVVDLLHYANDNNKKVYFIGGWIESLDSFITNIQRDYPKLIYQIDNEVAEVNVRSERGGKVLSEAVQRVNNFSPDILIVSLGPPLQEVWSYEHSSKLNASIIINAGATIDFISGSLRRAPKIIRRIGLEWLWRLFTQPTRLKRILYAFPYFPMKVMQDLMYRRNYRDDAV